MRDPRSGIEQSAISNQQSALSGPMNVPAIRHFHIRAIECRGRWTSEQFDRAQQIGAEDFDRAAGSGFACGADTIRVGASDEDGLGAETQRFRDIAASPYPA